MNSKLLAAMCFIGGGLVVGVTSATLAQDAETEKRIIEQERAAHEARMAAENEARREEELKTRRALELAGKATAERPVSDGIRVMESLNADQIRVKLKALESRLKAAKEAADPVLAETVAKAVAEFQALLKRAESGETVWRMAEGELADVEYEDADDEELELLLRRLDGRGPMPGGRGMWRERDYDTDFASRMLYSPSMPMHGMAEAFKIVENDSMKATFLLDTRTGETWWLEKSPRGVDGFAWKRVEREMPEPPRARMLPRGRIFELDLDLHRELGREMREAAERRVHELEKELEAARRRLEESRRGTEERDEKSETDKDPAGPSAPERRR
jgi:LPS O-antigen subunit length determinant protein (WzzB/FepE family)